MTVPDPRLQVYLGGVLRTDGAELPALLAGRTALDQLVVLDPVAVTWGADSSIGHPDPATARLSLLDFSRRWATGQEVSGLPVRLAWTSAETGTGRTFFRGRVEDVSIDWVDVPRTDGSTVRAARLELTCTSLETDLGNRFPAEQAWPAETLGDRAARLAGYCTDVAAAVRVRPYWAGYVLAAEDDPAQTSIRDHLGKLYTSCGGDRMVYNPDLAEYQSLPRQNADLRSLLRLAAVPGRGAVIASNVVAPATNDDTVKKAFTLDARTLGYADQLRKPATAGVTRAVLTYTNAAGEQVTIGKMSPAATGDMARGARAVTVDSAHRDPAAAELNAADVFAAVTQEGRLWQPGTVTFDSRRGFPTADHLQLLLRGSGTTWPVALQGSQLSVARIRPLFCITGGTITFTGGRWVIDATLAGWAAYGGGNATPTPTRQHPLNWAELNAGNPGTPLVWGHAGDNRPGNLDPSISYEDMRYVGRGPAAATTGPDTGWDFTL